MTLSDVKFVAAGLDAVDRQRFEAVCETAGLRVPSKWQLGRMQTGIGLRTGPNVLEQFDACSFPRAIKGLNAVLRASNGAVFVSKEKRLPNWKDRFGSEQFIISLDDFEKKQPSKTTTQAGLALEGPFAFVIPVVHPSGKKLIDYNAVERILQQTVRSCLLQSETNVAVVVVCHRVPDWADNLDLRVHFLVLGDDREWTASPLDVREDKGAKHVLGAQFALSQLNASSVMFLDGDDFVRSDLVSTVGNRLGSVNDGVVISSGLHAALKRTDKGFSLDAAIRVFGFHNTCGSCRVFRGAVLADRMRRWMSDIFELTFFEQAEAFGSFSNRAADMRAFFDQIERTGNNEFGLIRCLGRHAARSMIAELDNLSEPLVAKGCGHGNHDGPRKGEVHWNKCIGQMDSTEFAKSFSIDPEIITTNSPDVGLVRRSQILAPFNRAKRLFFIGDDV
ncbi:hypothetical protein BXY66_1464 [Shimia isoporae]|uniref:Glycosyl transferase family 2 n=1 Tax=Shimia isoporae TaxID=647720 RepID=A0A4R1NLZ6_9RHOB|nr:hypothetical protein [Shimia isoporae]TCL09417.1 hypothetical protein BXY66_1464 [Shimia isoporae]